MVEHEKINGFASDKISPPHDRIIMLCLIYFRPCLYFVEFEMMVYSEFISLSILFYIYYKLKYLPYCDSPLSFFRLPLRVKIKDGNEKHLSSSY